MALSLYFIVVLCLTSGLWTGANACCEDQCCDDCKTCPPGWTQFEDHCYKFQHAAKDWADAELACVGLGGNLASIHTKAVYDFIIKLIYRATNKNEQTWAGGHDSVKEKAWMWSDGSTFDFKWWGKGEPNNAGKSENCMELNYAGAPNDIDCTVKKPFVCGMRL